MGEKWEFGDIENDRKQNLENAPSYEQIVQTIEKDMNMLSVHEVPSSD